MSQPAPLAPYYAARSAEYETIYAKPERQADLARLRALVSEALSGRRVLEVACGTGWWTEAVAPAAASIVATDLTAEVLEVARAKALPPGRVTFLLADAYALQTVPGRFDAALAAFWWSHVPRRDLARFLAGLHHRLEPGAWVVALDNRYVEGSSTPLSRTDAHGDTYQRRRLADGSVHEVLKNFPDAAELRRAIVAAGGTAVEVVELEYYWLATWTV